MTEEMKKELIMDRWVIIMLAGNCTSASLKSLTDILSCTKKFNILNTKRYVDVDSTKHFVVPNLVTLIQVFSTKHLIGSINFAICISPAIPGTTLRVAIILNIAIVPVIYY